MRYDEMTGGEEYEAAKPWATRYPMPKGDPWAAVRDIDTSTDKS